MKSIRFNAAGAREKKVLREMFVRLCWHSVQRAFDCTMHIAHTLWFRPSTAIAAAARTFSRVSRMRGSLVEAEAEKCNDLCVYFVCSHVYRSVKANRIALARGSSIVTLLRANGGIKVDFEFKRYLTIFLVYYMHLVLHITIYYHY